MVHHLGITWKSELECCLAQTERADLTTVAVVCWAGSGDGSLIGTNGHKHYTRRCLHFTGQSRQFFRVSSEIEFAGFHPGLVAVMKLP